MSLDNAACANFRDVGEVTNLLADHEVLPLRRILRGGKLDAVDSAEQIGSPGTVINLRKGADPIERCFGADHWHFPISNDYEKYDTTDPVVRRWLNAIFRCLTNEVERLPILFHCIYGKDRTGVVVAALLHVLGIEREWIVQEYLWSDGEVERAWIERSLDGISDPALYFRGIDLVRLRAKYMSSRL